MTRSEKYQDHETAIAFFWLKESKKRLESGCPAIRLTNSFDSIVADWEESGKLRANHRKLDLQRAKEVASAQLKNCSEWKIVLDYFTSEQKQKPDTAEKQIAAVLKVYREAAPSDIAAETDLSVQKVVAVSKKSPLFNYRASYRKTCQGCMASEMSAGYYPAKVSLAQ